MTNSNHQILSTLDKLGRNHDAILLKARERISQENCELNEIKEKIKELLTTHETHQTCTPECHQESTHPGFVISFDNLDFQLQRKSMNNAVSKP